MPNFNTGTALASVAQGITKVWAQKHAEEVEEKQRNLQVLGNLVSGGLQAGTIKNPDEAFQFLFTQLGGGKGKGGKKGEIPDPVKRVIEATKLAGSRTAGGQEKPSFGGAPAAGGAAPQFQTGPEMDQAREASALRTRQGQADIAVEEKTRETEAVFSAKKRIADRLIAQGVKPEEAYDLAGLPKRTAQQTKWTPGSTPGSALPANATDIYGQAIDPAKHYRQGTDQEGTITFVPTETPAGQVSKEGTFTKYVQDALAATPPKDAAGKKALVDKLSTDWARSHQSMTFGEKVALAKERAVVLQTVGVPSAEDSIADAQAITVGGQERGYLDLGTFTGEKSKNAARAAATKAGIVPVTTQQANQLNASKAALGNLDEFFATLKSKMPPDAASRPLAQIELPLKQFFQTDEDLAAAVAWNITVLPQLRALNVTGRVPVFEYQQALAAQPRLTDTVGTASKKLATVRGILERGAASVLDRKGSPKPTAAPTDDQAARRTKARQHLLAAQQAGTIPKDATITDATIDQWLAKNPTFK